MPGDLNLKKAWHPSNRANLEKILEAQAKEEEERKKVLQIQKERKKEKETCELRLLREKAGFSSKTEERLDWMYSHPSSSCISSKEGNKCSAEESANKMAKSEFKNEALKKCDNWSKTREDPFCRL